MSIHESGENESALNVYSPINLPVLSFAHRLDFSTLNQDVYIERPAFGNYSSVVNFEGFQACSTCRACAQIIRVHQKISTNQGSFFAAEEIPRVVSEDWCVQDSYRSLVGEAHDGLHADVRGRENGRFELGCDR